MENNRKVLVVDDGCFSFGHIIATLASAGLGMDILSDPPEPPHEKVVAHHRHQGSKETARRLKRRP